MVTEIQMAPFVEFRRRRAKDSLCGGRAVTLSASLFFHWWLADTKEERALKKVKEKDMR
jgi:hypothetical protein